MRSTLHTQLISDITWGLTRKFFSSYLDKRAVTKVWNIIQSEMKSSPSSRNGTIREKRKCLWILKVFLLLDDSGFWFSICRNNVQDFLCWEWEGTLYRLSLDYGSCNAHSVTIFPLCSYIYRPMESVLVIETYILLKIYSPFPMMSYFLMISLYHMVFP